jgi:ABC-type dipeptide/oligopeptide/nickel transport system ATPase component
MSARNLDFHCGDFGALKAIRLGVARKQELIHQLKRACTVVIVTQNMQQAARVSDDTAFFYIGELVEMNATEIIFTRPKNRQTKNIITGRFGEESPRWKAVFIKKSNNSK